MSLNLVKVEQGVMSFFPYDGVTSEFPFPEHDLAAGLVSTTGIGVQPLPLRTDAGLTYTIPMDYLLAGNQMLMVVRFTGKQLHPSSAPLDALLGQIQWFDVDGVPSSYVSPLSWNAPEGAFVAGKRVGYELRLSFRLFKVAGSDLEYQLQRQVTVRTWNADLPETDPVTTIGTTEISDHTADQIPALVGLAVGSGASPYSLRTLTHQTSWVGVDVFENIDLSAYIPLSQKAAANGVASLGADGKVPDFQLPSSLVKRLWSRPNTVNPATGSGWVGFTESTEAEQIIPANTLRIGSRIHAECTGSFYRSSSGGYDFLIHAVLNPTGESHDYFDFLGGAEPALNTPYKFRAEIDLYIKTETTMGASTKFWYFVSDMGATPNLIQSLEYDNPIDISVSNRFNLLVDMVTGISMYPRFSWAELHP